MKLMLRNNGLSHSNSFESELSNLMREFFAPSLAYREAKEVSPAIELSDNGENIMIKAELPGVDKENVDIQVAEDYVSISGEFNNKTETKSEEGRVYRCELRQGSFIRNIPLPETVNHQQAQADFNNGILTLTLPKMEEKENSKVTKLKL